MDFGFNINIILRDGITTISSLEDKRRRRGENYEIELAKIVNDMGLASAKVRGIYIDVYISLLFPRLKV